MQTKQPGEQGVFLEETTERTAGDFQKAAERANVRPMRPAEAYHAWRQNPTPENREAVLQTLDQAIDQATNRKSRRHRQKLKRQFLAEARRRQS